MKVIAVVVQSINGKITRGVDERVYKWTSAEDKNHLKEMTAVAKLIVMGSTTYDAFKQYLKLSPNTLRVVMTSKPEAYQASFVSGQLEFTNREPKELVDEYGKKGFTELLLLGGSKVYSSFLEAGLIHELVLTVEPVIFGRGKPLFDINANMEMALISMEKLNDRGTLLLRYKIAQ